VLLINPIKLSFVLVAVHISGGPLSHPIKQMGPQKEQQSVSEEIRDSAIKQGKVNE
jgi:hypothetical protein